MMNGYEMTAAGWFWMVGGWVVLALSIIAGAWLVARTMRRDRSEPLTPLQILQERFARGEIGQDEYEKARQALR